MPYQLFIKAANHAAFSFHPVATHISKAQNERVPKGYFRGVLPRKFWVRIGTAFASGFSLFMYTRECVTEKKMKYCLNTSVDASGFRRAFSNSIICPPNRAEI
jgi:hypothetical protein